MGDQGTIALMSQNFSAIYATLRAFEEYIPVPHHVEHCFPRPFQRL